MTVRKAFPPADLGRRALCGRDVVLALCGRDGVPPCRLAIAPVLAARTGSHSFLVGGFDRFSGSHERSATGEGALGVVPVDGIGTGT